MRNYFRFSAFFLIVLVVFAKQCIAESNYVLPYPPQMPGSFMYKLRLISEEIQRYWYFGNFGQFDYNLKMSDKYLVEAKTLFEYKQYLLGYRSLQKSNAYFEKIMPYLVKADKSKKDIGLKRIILKEAAQKHIEVLEEMKIITPDKFIWQPERFSPTTLYLKKQIEKAIIVSKNNL